MLSTTYAVWALDTYTRPVPEVPQVKKPSDLHDVYSYSVAAQIHRTLFKLDGNRELQPSLVEKFSVLEKGMEYELKLGEWYFHNGVRLKASHVKASLEDLVLNKGPSYSYLKNIVGYRELMGGAGGGMAGLRVVSVNTIRIVLERPDPTLLRNLAEIYFYIWDLDAGPKNGLGRYRVSKESGTMLELRKTIKGGGGPDRLVFLKRDTERATTEYQLGKVDDLFFYSLSENSISKSLANISHVVRAQTPRTYYMALNSETVANIAERRGLSLALNREKLVKNCFPAEKLSNSWVPPGFAGHDESSGITEEKGEQILPNKTLSIAVVESIGGESCLRKSIKTFLLRAGVSSNVRVVSLKELMQLWISKSIDGFVAYMDGDTSDDFFSPISPDSGFLLGVKTDNDFKTLHEAYSTAATLEDRHRYASALARHIRDLFTVIPLFHPKPVLLYSNRYRRLETQFKSPPLVPIEAFELWQNKKNL